jgi:hypothetical protein
MKVCYMPKNMNSRTTSCDLNDLICAGDRNSVFINQIPSGLSQLKMFDAPKDRDNYLLSIEYIYNEDLCVCACI